MTGQANFLQSLGWAVLNSLWQMALLWVIYQVITGIFRNARTSFKSSLASSLLVGGFAWFIYTFISAYTSTPASSVLSSALLPVEGNQQVNDWLQRTLPLASVIYLVLLILPLLHFVRNYRYVQVIRNYGLSRMNVEWRMFVNKLAIQMGIRKKVQIWVSEFVASPVTIGFLKPVILVPLAAINQLTPQQMEAVLLHELSHIRRFDYLVNLIINFTYTLLYFNPFVKAFMKIVEIEREKSCDEMVLQFQYDSHEYATALLTLEKSHPAHKLMALGATGQKQDLLHRIELILGLQRKKFLSFNKLAGLMAGLLCVIALNAILLVSNPVNGSRAVSFAHIASPLNFIEDKDPGMKLVEVPAERPSQIVNATKKGKLPATTTPASSSFAQYVFSAVANPAIIQAGFDALEYPDLKKYQEKEVENAIKASKKVLESVQWKTVEKNIADAFNQREKEELKATYQKEMDKFDWNKWENKLKQAYDQIDWENINSQLSVAVNQVRLDSIQLVYSKAIRNLDGICKELCTNDLKGIPDTDISLHQLELKKAEVQKALSRLKVVRSRKIVHL